MRLVRAPFPTLSEAEPQAKAEFSGGKIPSRRRKLSLVVGRYLAAEAVKATENREEADSSPKI